MREAALDAQSALIAERGLSIEAQVLEVLADLMRNAEGLGVPVGAVTTGTGWRYGAEYERPVTDRWIGGILRERLNLRTYKSHGVYIVPVSERHSVDHLCSAVRH